MKFSQEKRKSRPGMPDSFERPAVRASGTLEARQNEIDWNVKGRKSDGLKVKL